MTGRLLVTLPEEEQAPLAWTRIGADGRVSGEGLLPAGARLETGDGDHVVVEVPGAAVTVRWFALDASSAAQARAAALYHARDVSASNLPLHVAVARAADPVSGWPVAMVSEPVMAAWLARLAVSGIDADVLTPAPLLLPEPADGFVAIGDEAEMTVRGAADAFVADAALARMIVGDAPLRHVKDAREALALKLAESEHPLINLRQGAFAKAGQAGDPRRWKRLAMIGTAIVILLLLSFGISAWRHDRAAARANARTAAWAEAVGVAVPAGADPVAAMRLAVAERGMGSGLRGASAALFAAVRAAPGTSLRSISWRDGRIVADVILPAGGDAGVLRPAVEGAGFTLVAGPMRADGEGRIASVEVVP